MKVQKRYCYKCGANNRLVATKCYNCGRSFVKQPKVRHQSQSQEYPKSPSKVPIPSIVAWVVAFIVALGVPENIENGTMGGIAILLIFTTLCLIGGGIATVFRQKEIADYNKRLGHPIALEKAPIASIILWVFGFFTIAFILGATEERTTGDIFASFILGIIFAASGGLMLVLQQRQTVKLQNQYGQPQQTTATRTYNTTQPNPVAKSYDSMTGREFEIFCADLLIKNGFTKVAVTKAINQRIRPKSCHCRFERYSQNEQEQTTYTI